MAVGSRITRRRGLNLVAMDTRAKFPGWGPQEADVVRWFIYGFLGLVGLLLVAVATLYLLIGHFNLASLASAALAQLSADE